MLQQLRSAMASVNESTVPRPFRYRVWLWAMSWVLVLTAALAVLFAANVWSPARWWAALHEWAPVAWFQTVFVVLVWAGFLLWVSGVSLVRLAQGAGDRRSLLALAAATTVGYIAIVVVSVVIPGT